MPGPLSEVKILDFSTLLPGPYATLLLADMGAAVLRIQSPARPDLADLVPPVVPEEGLSAASLYLGRNKRTLALNLKHPGALSVIHRLIMDYDVLLEQFRPGVMARLNLDYDRLSSVNPRLIYCSLTGYGQTGPLRTRAGHDINYLARSGVSSYTGKRSVGPALAGIQIADVASGSTHAVIGILAALAHRHRTGAGQQVDVAMTDGMIAFNALSAASYLYDGVEPSYETTPLNGGSLYDYYETKDGRYLSCGPLEEHFFIDFCRVVGRPDLAAGGIAPDNMAEVKEELRDIIRGETLQEWLSRFDAADACVEPVLSLGEALSDPHAVARGMVVDVPLPSGGTMRQPGCPLTFSGTRPDYRRSGVPAGTDTREVLQEAGYGDSEIAELEEAGLFRQDS